ncbi:MAG: peptide chain release factor N(5)-glutamine methyltransferase [Syntrophobacteraceae bacterium]|nr:peptide chain release factor N(5)-glutamine methyltransferase [Syntrophobacteraceae bacterium]
MEESWTILKVIQWTTEYLRGKGVEQPRADAEVLLAYVLGVARVELYINFDKPLADEELARYRGLIRRRGAREPSQYITGRQEFWSLEFEVTPAVLIPRPETEVIVEKALEIAGDKPSLVLDLGTGSGAIAVALVHERQGIRVVAADTSWPTIEVARRNGMRNGVAERIFFTVMDLFDGLTAGPLFDIIVTNPPYVSDAQILDLSPEIANYEPPAALRGGGNRGLAVIRKILEEFEAHLKPQGSLLMEIGLGQAEILQTAVPERWAGRFEFIEDYSGIRRVLHVKGEGVKSNG